MTGMSCAIRSSSASSERTKLTAPRTWRGRNHSNLDNRMEPPPKRPANGPQTGAGERILINRQRKHAIDTAHLRAFLSSLVPALRIESRSFTIVFLTDEKMRAYNSTYRGFDKPTDVLSFR